MLIAACVMMCTVKYASQEQKTELFWGKVPCRYAASSQARLQSASISSSALGWAYRDLKLQLAQKEICQRHETLTDL